MLTKTSKVIAATILSVAAVTSITLNAAEKADEKKPRQTAGYLEKPDAQQGKIVIVNNQKRVPESELQPAIDVIVNQTKCRAEIGSAEGAQVVVEVIDSETAPTLAAYPEDFKATVNVAKLEVGLKGSAVGKFLPGRCRNEILRAFCFACGAGGTQYPDNNMAISKISDLDLIKDGLFIPGDTAYACLRRLKTVGVTPKMVVPYGRACVEGWAPAPTNDIQRKIWTRIKEQKERGPSNPIKIAPPKK